MVSVAFGADILSVELSTAERGVNGGSLELSTAERGTNGWSLESSNGRTRDANGELFWDPGW